VYLVFYDCLDVVAPLPSCMYVFTRGTGNDVSGGAVDRSWGLPGGGVQYGSAAC
jgi:hypothetical protein